MRKSFSRCAGLNTKRSTSNFKRGESPRYFAFVAVGFGAT